MRSARRSRQGIGSGRKDGKRRSVAVAIEVCQAIRRRARTASPGLPSAIITGGLWRSGSESLVELLVTDRRPIGARASTHYSLSPAARRLRICSAADSASPSDTADLRACAARSSSGTASAPCAPCSTRMPPRFSAASARLGLMLSAEQLERGRRPGVHVRPACSAGRRR